LIETMYSLRNTANSGDKIQLNVGPFDCDDIFAA